MTTVFARTTAVVRVPLGSTQRITRFDSAEIISGEVLGGEIDGGKIDGGKIDGSEIDVVQGDRTDVTFQAGRGNVEIISI